MMPILYSWGAWQGGERTGNGKGILMDALLCTVTEEINGVYELTMKYALTGIHGANIKERDIILAKPNPTQRAQPFRIYRMTRPIGGVFTVYARHISYDLDDIPVKPFKALAVKNAVEIDILANSVIDNPFTFNAPISDPRSGVLEMAKPSTARAVLMGEDESIAGTFFTENQGQYLFDWYNVAVHTRRGADNGAKIEYGVNMTKYTKDTTRSEFYNGIYPYCVKNDESIVTLPEGVLMLTGWSFQKPAVVDFTTILKEEERTEENLRAAAQQYMTDNDFGKYKVSLDVSFVNLKDTAEYEHLAALQTISLGDTVEIIYPEYGESSKDICRKTVYNVLTEKYDSISIGKLRRGI